MEATYCVGSDVDVCRMFDQYLYKIITFLWLRGFPEKMKCIIQHNVRTVCSQKFKRTYKTLLFI
nr:unnamed protein product [Callosobruchus analis]